MLELGLVKVPLLPPPDVGWDAYLQDLPRVDLEYDLAPRFPLLRELFVDNRKRERAYASEDNLLPGNGKRQKPWVARSPKPPVNKRTRTQPLGPSATELRQRYVDKPPARKTPSRPPLKSPMRRPTPLSPRSRQHSSPKARSTAKAQKTSKKREQKTTPEPAVPQDMDIFMNLMRTVGNQKVLTQPVTRE